MTVLGKTITCRKTLALIKSGLKAGYIIIGDIVVNESKGTPQGSVISPLLCNIFLHEFDTFVDNLIAKNTKGKSRRQNPA